MKKIENGVWEICDTVSEPVVGEPGAVFSITEMRIGGYPHKKARAEAIASLFDNELDLMLDAGAAREEQVTVLLRDKGTGYIRAREGRLVISNGKLALMNKGARSKGIYLDRERILDISFGYGHQAALDSAWQLHAKRVPELEEARFDGIPEYEPEDEGWDSPQMSAVFMYTHPGFGDGPAAGCLFFARDVQPPEGEDDGIVNGYCWVPPGSGLCSEHGSVYYAQLNNWGGRVANWTPGRLTFRDCLSDGIPEDRRQAYAFVLERSAAAVSA